MVHIMDTDKRDKISDNCVVATLYVCTSSCFTGTQDLQVIVSPSVVTSDSSEQFRISCRAKNRKTLYKAQYQFFFNGSPIDAPSNSSHIMVNATLSGNFTCNATQYSDQGTAIPNEMSPPVQATVLCKSTKHHLYNINKSTTYVDI